jgi:hypothetical protein
MSSVSVSGQCGFHIFDLMENGKPLSGEMFKSLMFIYAAM